MPSDETSARLLAPGAGLFRAFRVNNDISQDEAGKQLGGISAPSLSAWETGTARPKAHVRKRVAIWTQGAVPEESWLLPGESAEQAPFQKRTSGAA